MQKFFSASTICRFTVVALLTLFATLSQAQNQASITGVVTDGSGAVVAGANVTLENATTGGVVFKAVTNGLGSYTIANVAAGPGYKITFSANGFKSVVITGIYLSVTTTRTQNAKLEIGSQTQSVEVSASAENVTLNTTDATVGNSFQVAELNDLPVANRDSPSALFYQQPGVTLSGAVTGARTDQSNVTVDGLEVNDNATGQFGSIVGNAPVDSIQEFRGVTSGETASSGQGGGGQFELVTKTGTNQFHGAVVEYHRDTDLQANNWFNNNNGTPRPPLIRNQFGADVGGPIWRDKAFFFFDWESRKDTLSNLEDRTVPMGTNTSGYRGGQFAYVTDEGDIATMTNSQLAAYDPNGIGWNQAEISLFQKRFPQANDLSGVVGDLVNTAGYRFNAPFPWTENNYVPRIDYTLNDKMKLYGQANIARTSATESAIQFPGDPTTAPYYDHSYRWFVGHTWTIGSNKVNQAEFGYAFEDFSFKIIYNPQGITQYSFGGLSGPYAGGNNSQARTYPIPVIRDDFSWQKGNHDFRVGGTFKWKTPDEFAAEDYNFPTIGLDTNAGFAGLTDAQRPEDLDGDYTSIYDSAFATALGVVPAVNSNFNYNNKGAVLPQGTGLDLKYRNYETEVYFSDSWKIKPNFTITYGLRYQNFTVPYEMRGEEAITNLNTNGTTSTFSWDTYWKDRLKQSAAGDDNPATLPFFQFIYGGKVNHQPGYFHPSNKNFAPRVSFSWSPGSDSKTVIRGGAGILYDYSLINALQFQQLQTSYVFEASGINEFTGESATDTIANAPRFAGLSNPPTPPTAPAIVTPYIPFVDFSEGADPEGLAEGQFNLMMDTNLKTPYNIQLSLGFQHEFPKGFILKMDYSGRLGRRLLATADASQLLDFPDNTGGSSQTMGQAVSAMDLQYQHNKSLSNLNQIYALSAQPWFEDMVPSLVGYANYYYGTHFTNNIQAISYLFYPLAKRGDFADLIQALAGSGLLGYNVGMSSQFASNSVWTNKGSSNYHGLLVTLHKNVGYGLRFDLNYTWSHSIDNVSIIANSIASSNGFGFICDVQRPRECRGTSDFDAAGVFNGNFIYDLPFGRGRTFGATMPFWLNEAVGGWTISGLPSWRSGLAYNASSNAYITSFANNAPATLIGQTGVLKTKLHGGNGQRLQAFASGPTALAAFQGPTGFDIGSRNNLRGPQYFNIDLGVAKTFPIWGEKTWLKFRCDAFNALNHPNFNLPNVDITQASGVPFGTIGSTNGSARVLQGVLRLEF